MKKKTSLLILGVVCLLLVNSVAMAATITKPAPPVIKPYPYVVVTDSNGGNLLQPGKEALIKWNFLSGSSVDIRLSCGSNPGQSVLTIATGIQNDANGKGSYTWHIPTDIRTPGCSKTDPAYKISVLQHFTTVNTPDTWLHSGAFSLQSPQLTFLSPSPSQPLSETENFFQLKWTATGELPPLNLYLVPAATPDAPYVFQLMGQMGMTGGGEIKLNSPAKLMMKQMPPNTLWIIRAESLTKKVIFYSQPFGIKYII